MKYNYLLIALTLGGCAGGPSDRVLAVTDGTVCEQPRPQICTADYTPVCATLVDASRKTYSNGCSACADADVQSWVADACPE